MNKELIKGIVLSKGWSEVERVLKKEFDNIEVDTNKNINEIGKRFLAKKLAIKSLNSILAMLNSVKNEEKKNKIIYR